jgi:uncharacterized membrane protein YhaH (DUF805 family)
MDLPRLFSFDGRINRQTYWIIAIALFIIEAVVAGFAQTKNTGLIALGVLVFLAVFIPALATQVKRWHDRNKSGWWVLISLVPLIGALWSFIELGFLAGTPDANRFGQPSSGTPFAR